MSEVEWGEYELQNLFYITGTKSLDSNAVDFTNSGINFVGRTYENNGIQGKIERRNFEPNEPNTITATVIGNYKYVKFQTEEYYCSQNINKLSPKSIFKKWNKAIAYFMVANIQRFVSLYDGQQGGYKLEDIKQHKIKLPIKNNSIDFNFMEAFIAELEALRIAELEAYLLATGLEDYNLTIPEKQAIENLGKTEFCNYKIGELFFVLSYKRRFDANKVTVFENGEYPYVVRMGTNNGQKGYINEDVEYLNDGNTISFGQDTATVFYQEKPYFTGDKIKILKPKEYKFSKKNAFCFLTSISKAFESFSWGSSSFSVKIIENQDIVLPTKNGSIDYEYMETLISAIQKLVIKDVVLYADRKISATKSVISNQN